MDQKLPKPKRMKHQYTDELELKSLIIRINNRKVNDDNESYKLDDSDESINSNALINRYIKFYIKMKSYRSQHLSRTDKLRFQRKQLKQLIIDLSVDTTIDKLSYELFGSIVLLMIKAILSKNNFSKMGFDSEFYSDSVYKISKYIYNFDHLKISVISGLPGNAFAYISQIIHNSFLYICNQKRDEKIHHKQQVLISNLDENYKLINEDMFLDDKTLYYSEEINIKKFNIDIIKYNSLINHIKEILNECSADIENISKIIITYPEDYRISFDEFEKIKPLLNGKININRYIDYSKIFIKIIKEYVDMNTSQRILKSKKFNKEMIEAIKGKLSSRQYDNIIQFISLQMLNDPSVFVEFESLEFMNYIVNVHENPKNTIELFYPFIMSSLLYYVEKIKERDSCSVLDTITPLTDIVVGFSDYTGIDIEILGSMCEYDSYFKKFLEYENKEFVTGDKGTRLYKEYNVEVSTDLLDW